MEPINICGRCNMPTNEPHLFSCNHTICSQCITRIIAFSHIKNIVTQDQIQITCSCKLGTKNVKVADIPQFFTESDFTAKCNLHGATAKIHCLICELWLCDECDEVHKLFFNSHHQMARGQICFSKCTVHEGQIKDIYCHNCQVILCPSCILLKDTCHINHNYQLAKDYAGELKNQIQILDATGQVNRIEEMRRDFLREVDCVLEKTLKKMDEVINLLEESKLIYKERMKQTLQRADILFNLLQVCYLDVGNSEDILNIHLMKDLSTWNMGFSKLELQDEIELKMKTFQDSFEECLQRSPLEAIHAAWIVRDWRKNTMTLTGHKSYVSSLMQLKDGRLVSGSKDNTIKVWELKKKEYQNTLTLYGHNNGVSSVVQLKDGRIASGSEDGTVKIWEVKETEFKNTLTIPGYFSVTSLIQLEDERIASGVGDNKIKIWDLKEKEFKSTLILDGHTAPVYSLIQLKDGRVVSGSSDKTIKVWEVKGKDIRNTMTLIGHNSGVSSLIQLKDGRIVSGSYDNTIKVWELKEKEFKNTMTLIGHNNGVSSLIVLEDGRIVSGSYDTTIKVWEVKNKEFKNTMTLVGHVNTVYSVIQVKDGRIVSGSLDNTIKVWD